MKWAGGGGEEKDEFVIPHRRSNEIARSSPRP